ncbi:AhpC/TSA family protein [Aestuariibacter sp. AA17]|uniref:thioredoxin-dependent peroxiredoxin n=1 Tax=Fluctibacter corallii TaxID=2984329 RepID=A0ABT3AD18_9ALTE|nr:peroxiredoxin-like family protein [Aestuariibacter sp. AA17]MCV2886192.1 AhpC/TSA family protein [Aestuariibacter sp. AA17]
MKSISSKLAFALLGLCLFSVSTHAASSSRPAIAESAELVTPLLNGQTVSKATVKTADGAVVSLKAMFMQKPTIVLFYRGGWCPYCSRQLAGLKDIEAQLVDLGYQVLAISPESPERLQAQKLETEFAVTLLSDEQLNAIKAFGVGFYMDDATAKDYQQSMQISLTKDADTGKPVLPAPAVFVVDKNGQVVFNYVNPNFRVRISPELLYQAAKLSR